MDLEALAPYVYGVAVEVLHEQPGTVSLSRDGRGRRRLH